MAARDERDEREEPLAEPDDQTLALAVRHRVATVTPSHPERRDAIDPFWSGGALAHEGRMRAFLEKREPRFEDA